jgi:hypothetical protein
MVLKPKTGKIFRITRELKSPFNINNGWFSNKPEWEFNRSSSMEVNGFIPTLSDLFYTDFSPAALMLITINFSGTKAGEITFFSLDCAYKVCALEF